MRVASIHTYPIKGCYRVDRHDCEVQPWGLAGDRRWMVVDPDGTMVTQRQCPRMTQVRPAYDPGGALQLRATGMPQLTVPEPADGPLVDTAVWGTDVPGRAAGADADEWLSTALDRRVRLLWLDDPQRRAVVPQYAQPGDRVSFADRYPLLIANQASLEAVNKWLREADSLEGPLPMNRFRPNVVVKGASPWAEDGWVGGRIRLGPTVFRVAQACKRCVVTTTDQETGQRGKEPLRVLAARRVGDWQLRFGVLAIPDRLPGRLAVGDEVAPVELADEERVG